MRLQSKLAVLAGTMVLGLFPAVAFGTPGGHPKASSSPTQASKAKAYGKFCQGESKLHAAGTPGTPFSKCVTDMAKVAHGSTTNPAKACANESKKHVAGHPGTPYSLCVSGAKKLLKQQAGG
jgi:hypothetical protein